MRPALRRALATVLLVLLLAPGAAAQAGEPPATASRLAGATLEAAAWVGPDNATIESDVRAGASGTLWLAYRQLGANATNGTILNLTIVADAPDALGFDAPAASNLTVGASQAWAAIRIPFRAAANASGPASFSVVATFREPGGNGTVVDSFTFPLSVTVLAAEVAAPGGLPTAALVALVAGVLVVGGAGAYAMKQRADRRRMNRAPRRSQALREEALEREATKRPAEAQRVQEELRAQEVVREKRRELQILEAKRQDALKTIELLRRRHEAGALTKHQFDNMVGKKQADLARIEAEIAQMEREDAGAAA